MVAPTTQCRQSSRDRATYNDQQAFGFRIGYADKNGAKILVCSLSSANITVTNIKTGESKVCAISGGDSAFVGVGSDAPAGHAMNGKTLGYVGYVTLVDGLSENEFHNISVTQSGVTYYGRTFVIGNDPSFDFAYSFLSCENNNERGGQNSSFYYYHKKYSETDGNLPLAAIIHVDDHYGYTGFLGIDDRSGTGHYFTDLIGYDNGTNWPNLTGYEYDAALGFFAAFGLFSDTTKNQIKWGHETSRIWAMRNLNVWPQIGNHDNNTSIVLSLYKKFADDIGPPRTANQSAHGALSWAVDAGSVKFVSPDQQTLNGGTNGTPLDANNGSQQIHGPDFSASGQIVDCLNEFNTDHAFKVLPSMFGVRYMAANGDGGVTLTNKNAVVAHPLANEHQTDYKALFTTIGATPPTLMDNPKTNGVQGSLVMFTGDYHSMSCIHHEAPAYSGNAAENFYQFTIGTNNGSYNFPDDFSLKALAGNYTHDGSTLEAYETGNFGGGQAFSDFWGVICEVRASSYPKEMHIRVYDQCESLLWGKKFVERRGGNFSYEFDVELGDKTISVDSLAVAFTD